MKTQLKVTLVCNGRFYYYDLARELLKMEMLAHLFTGYPFWKLRGEEIPMDRVTTFPWFQTPYMALSRWGLLGHGRFERDLTWYAHEMLDCYTDWKHPQGNILMSLSGSGLRCGQAMQARGGRFICDRGSSHIRFQNEILKDEFARWGEEFRGIDPRMLAKEEAEYEASDIITVPSTFAYRSFIEMGVPDNKIRTIPYGVNLHLFEKVTDPPSDKFEVLFVGQVCFRKGVPDLLEAFRRFSHSNKHLTVIGSMSPEMERYLRFTPPPENVEFLRPIPQSELKQLMSRSHVMVLPSIEEGMALVQAMALACGCPVIGTTNSGAEDLFTDGIEGFIVTIRDPDAITEKLQQLSGDPEKRRSMSEAGLARVADLDGWHSYGLQITKMFQEVIIGG